MLAPRAAGKGRLDRMGWRRNRQARREQTQWNPHHLEQEQAAAKKALRHVALAALVWCGGVGLFSSLALYDLHRHRDAQGRFLSTSGVILTSKYVRAGEDMKSGLTYRYRVGHRDYVSERYRFAAIGLADDDYHRDIVRRHPVGAGVTVYYDPDDPATSILELSPLGANYVGLLCLQPFWAVGIALVVASFRAWVRHSRLVRTRPGDPRWIVRGRVAAPSYAQHYGLLVYPVGCFGGGAGRGLDHGGCRAQYPGAADHLAGGRGCGRCGVPVANADPSPGLRPPCDRPEYPPSAVSCVGDSW